ncbi:uncharacterized protein LOC134709889 [Mytilus trossulus]|uniref:uncharacterized protein LOC134709889 n=1 Tax=Mytilus trossulus TaxID=6551 RepID=UPI003007CD95
MASLSVEEENYVRMSLLLTGVSPRAARTFFDSEFAPACLEATIKKEYNKLHELRKTHIINQSQWNLLFTKSPDVPDSKLFDVTLMILLLRNLTSMNPPLCGFDKLPFVSETTQAADLARIKYYRNKLAHLQDCKVDTAFFTTAWTDITCAIHRLGGQQMEQECGNIKTMPLDQTNQEIIMDIKRSNEEIKGLKKSFRGLKRSQLHMRRSNESQQETNKKVKLAYTLLQKEQKEVKKSHELLQEDHKKIKESNEFIKEGHIKVTKDIEILKTYQEDTVPWNIRARIEKLLKTWKENDQMFIKTRAADHVLKCIKENNCVTIIASSGVGKTATLRHVAIQMIGEGYDVLMVTEPVDIVNYNNPKKKTLFVFDDLCGNYSVDQSDIKKWDPVMETITNILDEKRTKILAACRLQVYQDEKFKSLSVFKSCVCNLLSDNMRLSKTEKQSLSELYLKAKASEITAYYDLHDCFPLLCKLYNDNPKRDVTDFFKNPFTVYKAEVDKFFEKGYHAKYCVLALCVMFNNKFQEEILTKEVNEETRAIIENTFEACRLDRGTSRLVLQDELNCLTHTFIIKEEKVYKTIHDKLFDFLAYFFGQKMTSYLIKNADSGLIKERFLLERNDNMNQFITIIPTNYHEMYIQRMIDDWSKGKVQDVFSNINMEIPRFRQKFCGYLLKLDKSYQCRLAHTSDFRSLRSKTLFQWHDDNDGDWYDTALLHCCYLGDISLVKWCCTNGVDVNRCSYISQSPVIIACEYGHTELVKMLLDGGADCNKCDELGRSPLMKACEHGHIEIMKMLLDKGADCNKCDKWGRSPVMKACEHGHIEIMKMLLDKGADCNKCDELGGSPLMKACEHGHIEIMKTLLDKGADCNKCYELGRSPLMVACELGQIEIVNMLLERGADCNKCDKFGRSPLMVACEQGQIEIANMLLERGADCNKCDKLGRSPLLVACYCGHTELVKILLERGADCNKCDEDGLSPLLVACKHGHIDIVKMLLERGADCNKCDKLGRSPLMVACYCGHTELVKILLERGADCNKCDEDGLSPLLMACEQGQIEIANMLLERGADCNKCDKLGRSPLMVACYCGHTELVKILLERGADCYKCDELGQSPLLVACEQGHIEIMKMLLDKGADCNKCDWLGKSPLMMACKLGHIEIMKMLLDKGAHCNKCDWLGKSPLMKACKLGHIEIVKMLLERGADCNKCNNEGLSPLMIAKKHGHTEIVKMLCQVD